MLNIYILYENVVRIYNHLKVKSSLFLWW